jgi:hypothetical protein
VQQAQSHWIAFTKRVRRKAGRRARRLFLSYGIWDPTAPINVDAASTAFYYNSDEYGVDDPSLLSTDEGSDSDVDDAVTGRGKPLAPRRRHRSPTRSRLSSADGGVRKGSRAATGGDRRGDASEAAINAGAVAGVGVSVMEDGPQVCSANRRCGCAVVAPPPSRGCGAPAACSMSLFVQVVITPWGQRMPLRAATTYANQVASSLQFGPGFPSFVNDSNASSTVAVNEYIRIKSLRSRKSQMSNVTSPTLAGSSRRQVASFGTGAGACTDTVVASKQGVCVFPPWCMCCGW